MVPKYGPGKHRASVFHANKHTGVGRVLVLALRTPFVAGAFGVCLGSSHLLLVSA